MDRRSDIPIPVYVEVPDIGDVFTVYYKTVMKLSVAFDDLQ